MFEDSKLAFRFLEDIGSTDWMLLGTAAGEEKAGCRP